MVRMRKLLAWLGVATLFVLASIPSSAHANDALKPYVTLILDTSGSMVWTSSDNPTGAGPPSCGGIDNKLNHAKCAINNIVNSFGDMVFALGRFRTTMGGTTTTATFPSGCCEAGPNIGANNGCAAGPACDDTNTSNGVLLQMLTGLVDGGNQAAAKYTDFTGDSCVAGGNDPEIWDAENKCNGGGGTCGGATPLEGVLRGTKRYLQGLQAGDGTVLWPSNQPGYRPIFNDPLKTVFLSPPGKTTCDPNPTTCSSAASCTTNCCCLEQCRPYVVILLTDGAESCGDPTLAATSLLDTRVDNRKYRVRTVPIGFGIAPGNQQIEDIAHAGGAPDLPGNQGYYAKNEADLQLAISQILADTVRAESCNGLDDDCDTLVDEDFPNKGGTCTNGQKGNCLRTGTLECRADGTGLQCNAVTVTPGSEGTQCNQMDDDCDGLVDEGLGCTSCVPVAESCNNKDDDCNGIIDDGLTRACGQGTCLGTEKCTDGVWGGTPQDACSAPLPTAEICDGKDNDCDGVCDGLTTGCSEVNGTCDPDDPASCPQTDSPGDPGHYTTPDAAETSCADAIDDDLDGLVNDGCPANGAAETGAECSNAIDDDGDGAINDGCPVPTLPIPQNVCQPGGRICRVGCAASKSYEDCSGEVKPLANDPCNGLDDDCDNKIDEDFTPADCSTNCGVGHTKCVNGTITCDSTPATDDTTCDNVDDDCDGLIDEDWTCANPVNGKCPCGAGQVCDGEEKCINGVVQCTGDPVGVETCNCVDDDCDGQVDEDPDPNDPNTNICPGGATCTNCQCAFPCAQSEFPCPFGKKCENNYCVNDPCYGVTCPTDGNAQTCIPKPGNENEPLCVDTCSITTCPPNFICYEKTGTCSPDDCVTFPERCTEDEACVVNNTGLGECVPNPCKDMQCPADKYCLGGTCVASCADVTCPTGQRCRQGVCETDPCGHPCPFGYACNDVTGECIEDPCKVRQCPQGQWCNPNDGLCELDPCVANDITCPNEGELCRGGTCLDPETLRPDAAGATHVTVGGGGGGCSTTGGSGLLVALALLVTRRRRRSGGAR